MRLGINLLCATGQVGEEHRPLFNLARDLGFDGLEIPVLSGTPDDYAEIGRWLDDAGLARTSTAIVPDPEADPTSSDAEVRARGVSHLDWIVECATALGAEIIGGPFHAPIGHFTGAGPTEDEYKRGAEAHRAMAEKAAAGKMTLALEPLNRFETHFMNTAEQARRYADMVSHPAFGILYDTFHSHIEEKDQAKAVAHLGDRIALVHVSENDRGIPGTGQVDFAAALGAVRKTGYDGWVVVEAFGSGVPELAAATRIWRPLFPDTETLFRAAAPFVRDAWEAAG